MKTLRNLLTAACVTLLSLTAASAAVQGQHADHASHDQHAAPSREAPWPEEVVALAESLAVQDGGRVKPLHTHASFMLLRINGKRTLRLGEGDDQQKLSAVEWFLDVLFFPDAASDYKIFLVQNPDVITAIGVSVAGKDRRDRYSFSELRPGLERLFQLASEYARIEQKSRTPVQQQVFLLASNVREYLDLSGHMEFARRTLPLGPGEELAALFGGQRSIHISDVVAQLTPLLALRDQLTTSGRDAAEIEEVSSVVVAASEVLGRTESLALIPPALDAKANAEWLTPSDLFFISYDTGSASEYTLDVLRAFEGLAASPNDPAVFTAELRQLHTLLSGRADARGEYEKIGLELTYYKSKVLDYSHYAFVLAFLLMAFLWLRPNNNLLYTGTFATVLVATGLLIAAITLRCLIRERPPVSTLYETVLFVTGVAAVLGLCLEFINRRRIAISAAAVFGVIGLFIANGYEVLDKRDTMPALIAVLDTNFWLATHVTCITIGYSAGMLAALLASVYLIAKAIGWRRSDPGFYPALGQMVYGVLCFALIFSTVGTILGGIWANDSWGRFWGWDPKENGALLIVLSQLVILHARMGGYLREHGVCMATAFGGTVIAFSWWGVNLLGVGLHSYGFTSGISAAVWSYYYIQWAIVGIGALTWFRERSDRNLPSTTSL